MACQRVVVTKMMKKIDLMEKILKKNFFPWKKGDFDQKLRGESKKNGLDALRRRFWV